MNYRALVLACHSFRHCLRAFQFPSWSGDTHYASPDKLRGAAAYPAGRLIQFASHQVGPLEKRISIRCPSMTGNHRSSRRPRRSDRNAVGAYMGAFCFCKNHDWGLTPGC